MSVLGSCSRHVIKVYSLIVLLGTLGLLVFCGLKARASGYAWTDVESLWFPAWLATMSGLLMLQALLAGAGMTFEAPSLLNMSVGMVIALLPTELAWLGLTQYHSVWLLVVAQQDPTGAFSVVLKAAHGRPLASAATTAALVVLQLLTAALAMVRATGLRRRQRYPWSRAWEDVERQPHGACSPSLLRPAAGAYGSAASALGYYTPRSRPGTPETSPVRVLHAARGASGLGDADGPRRQLLSPGGDGRP